MMHSIYLDHNSTTPLLPEAWEATRAAPRGNPSSAHATGRSARQALESARELIAALLGAFPDEVIFTSGATEANNLAVFGLRSARVLVSQLEHPCVIEPLRQLETRGVRVECLPVNRRGTVVADFPDGASEALVCVMLVNHETGAIQPVRDFVHSLPPGAKLHCDAVQAVGKLSVNFHDLGATTLSASAHKFGGPMGVGVLLVKRDTALTPLTYGGHQQQGRRPGTEPVPLAVGMAAALATAVRNLEANHARLVALRARFMESLVQNCSPVVLNGPEIGAADALPTTLNVSFPGCRADLLLVALDLAGVACATGSACSSGSLLPSPVLRAMGLPEELLRSSLRFSFSASQSEEEINEALSRIAACVKRIRAS